MCRGPADFEAFERAMIAVHERQPLPILSYCLLSNHWHFIVYPEEEGQLTNFFQRLGQMHAIRWRVMRRKASSGHLYQGRFRCFPVQAGSAFLSLARYVERNALSAGLVERAEEWPWGSLGARASGDKSLKRLLSPWPVKRPANWVARVNAPLTPSEIARARVSIERSRPYGDDEWVSRTVKELGLEHTVRPQGRPRKMG